MRNSKKFYIWAFIVLAVISFSFYFQYRGNNQILKENTKQITETNVELLNEKINNWLNNRAQLIDDAKNYISLDKDNDQQILEYLKELLDQNESYFTIYFGTFDNKMVNASGWQMPEGFDLRDRPWYQKAVDQDSLVYTKAFINASKDHIIITVAAPVYSKNDNSFLGVIAGDVSITTIISFVKEQNIIENGYFMLIDSKNNILAHPDIEYSLDQGLPVLDKKYDQYIDPSINSKIITKDIIENEKEGFFSYTNIKNTDWILASFTPLEHYTETFSQLYRSFIFAVITSLLITIIFLWFQNMYVIKPLSRFNNNIRKIDIEDSLDYRMPPLENSEFNYLVESVNIVLAKAQDYFIELREKKDSINYIANHDSLTDLPNRRKFMEYLRSVLKADKKGAVMFIDLDNFKEINDMMGHTFGDKILVEVAKRLESIEKEYTFISRFGGDEFLILIEDDFDLDQLNKYIEKIDNIFEKPIVINDNNFHISFSMGISLFPEDSKDIDLLISKADTAMHLAKNITDKNYLFFDQTMTEKLKEEKKIEDILWDAVENDGFILHYQPQINLKSGEADCFEALIRLKDYDIPPDQFIFIAEERGLINKIGRWVTKKVINQIIEWKEKNRTVKSVSLNFSPYQLNDINYVDFLDNLITENNIDPSLLEIEITENILLVNKKTSIKFLNNLRDLGVKIVLDDFGKGFSSLNYLTYIPVDKVKLDKSLIDQFITNDNYETIESLISLIHSLNLKVVAEGIEEDDKKDKLIELGCDYIQGYIFSKPQDIEFIKKIYDKKFL